MPPSNTTVHNIGDRFWPTKPTTNKTMTEIRQIRFFFPEDAPEAPEGFFAIYDKNLFTRPPSLPTYRTILPNAYINHILRIVNRNAIYIIVHDIVHTNNHLASKFKDVKTLLAELRLNIEYNDNVMDAIWEDAENAVLMKKMTMDWRSPELDAWLVIEHLVDNHSPDAKAQYLITKAKSTLEQDPEELGEYLNWTEQDDLPDWYTGQNIIFDTTEGELTKAANEYRYARYVAPVLRWISQYLGWQIKEDLEGQVIPKPSTSSDKQKKGKQKADHAEDHIQGGSKSSKGQKRKTVADEQVVKVEESGSSIKEKNSKKDKRITTDQKMGTRIGTRSSSRIINSKVAQSTQSTIMDVDNERSTKESAVKTEKPAKIDTKTLKRNRDSGGTSGPPRRSDKRSTSSFKRDNPEVFVSPPAVDTKDDWEAKIPDQVFVPAPKRSSSKTSLNSIASRADSIAASHRSFSSKHSGYKSGNSSKPSTPATHNLPLPDISDDVNMASGESV